MRHLLFAFLAMAGMAFTPAFAQEAPTEPAPVEEAIEAPSDDAAVVPAEDAAVPVEEAKADDAAAPAPAEAVEGSEEAKAPTTDEEAVKTAMHLLEAVQAGQWPLAVGLLLTLLVYGANRFALKDKVGEKIIPWVAGGIGMAGAVGVGLLSGEAVLDSLVAGGIAAVAAIGGWEAVLKHVTAGKSEDKPAEEPKPAES